MSDNQGRDLRFCIAATVGAIAFYALLSAAQPPETQRGPHPGLRDGALQQALREARVHKPLSSLKSRHLLFSSIDGDGRKTLGRYTGTTIRFQGQPLPHLAQVEQAWPTSRISDPDVARTDLHQLFPVTAEANLVRANFHYGEVDAPVWSKGGSKVGASLRARRPVFEVRPSFRGDVARAIFYMSTMYELPVPDHEEEVLRRWHQQDPVDANEARRNDGISRHQKSRNPFIDHPGLVDRIRNF